MYIYMDIITILYLISTEQEEGFYTSFGWVVGRKWFGLERWNTLGVCKQTFAAVWHGAFAACKHRGSTGPCWSTRSAIVGNTPPLCQKPTVIHYSQARVGMALLGIRLMHSVSEITEPHLVFKWSLQCQGGSRYITFQLTACLHAKFNKHHNE